MFNDIIDREYIEEQFDIFDEVLQTTILKDVEGKLLGTNMSMIEIHDYLEKTYNI